MWTMDGTRDISNMQRAADARPGTGPIARIVAASASHAWVVLVAAIALVILAGVHTARNFAMTSDSLELISPDSPWRLERNARKNL